MYEVELVNRGDSTFEAISKDYKFIIDTQGKGITPPDTLLASLGSCVGVYLRKYCEGAKLDLKEFSIKVRAEFSQDAPICFRHIEVLLDLKDSLFDERRKKALLEFIKNCPVHQTLEANPEIVISIS